MIAYNTSNRTMQNKEYLDFAEKAVFKSRPSFRYFNLNDGDYQIRIYKNNKSGSTSIKYHTTLHKADKDGYGYDPYHRNEPAINLRDAKAIAGKFYFETIRE